MTVAKQPVPAADALKREIAALEDAPPSEALLSAAIEAERFVDAARVTDEYLESMRSRQLGRQRLEWPGMPAKTWPEYVAEELARLLGERDAARAAVVALVPAGCAIDEIYALCDRADAYDPPPRRSRVLSAGIEPEPSFRTVPAPVESPTRVAKLRILGAELTQEAIWKAARSLSDKIVAGELEWWGRDGSLTAKPSRIPGALALDPAVKIDWARAELRLEGAPKIYQVEVRVSESAKVERKEPGRPSREGEIVAAYDALVEVGEIDGRTSQGEATKRVRDRVAKATPQFGIEGLGDETIRLKIWEKHKQLKAG